MTCPPAMLQAFPKLQIGSCEKDRLRNSELVTLAVYQFCNFIKIAGRNKRCNT